MFSDRNPLLRPLTGPAETVRQHRRPVATDTPFLHWQKAVSQQIEAGLDRWRDVRDATAEAVFEVTYGNPLLQALAGLRTGDDAPRRRPGVEPEERAFVANCSAESAPAGCGRRCCAP